MNDRCCKISDIVDLTSDYQDMQVCLNCGQFFWMVNPKPSINSIRMSAIDFSYIKEELIAKAVHDG